ncbi:hypothetical protein LUZ63_010419 [Rhynchospora breviuscula]|uniref:Uncharacterized protein n=1 Tax=Rhynchospora breviuscula TaxID=2022672 RepID=A0A9Q0CGY3_9POAL|nr:hypothetical protein LUZ63_010419 [Rhynchospora breviuscula]
MTRLSILALVAVSVLLMRPSNVQGMTTNAQEFTIYGSVLCQDCTQGWNTFAYGATPIPGAKVDITCPDKKGRPVYHYSDLTDDTGIFRVTISYNYNGFTLDPPDCIVRLVFSPTDCNIMTNFNKGRDGVSPTTPTTYHPEQVEFGIGSFYFTIPQCGIPE